MNHNIRSEEELAAEMALNQANCKHLGVDLEIVTLEPGRVKSVASERKGGIEDAARALRYEALETARKAHQCDYILTAHHRQDQVETIIMRLGRSVPFSSLKGISEIDEKRSLVRPLLDFSRKELEKYVRDLDMKWSTDSTNLDSSYLRNHVRNDVVPQLSDILEDYEDLLLDLGNQARDVAKRLTEDITAQMPLSAFDNLGPLEASEVLFSMWDGIFPGIDLPQSLLCRVLSAIRKKTDCKVGSNGAIFCIYHQSLYLVDPSQDAVFQNFEQCIDVKTDLEVPLPGGIVLRSGLFAQQILERSDCSLDASKVLCMDSEKFQGPCVVRFARVGDQIRLKDGTKMVMRLLQDMKIPSCLRKRVPVLVDGDGVCAVFGCFYGQNDRICVKFRTSLAPNRFTQYIVSKG